MTDYISELFKVDKSLWPKIWCTLNCWEFPEELIHVKPDWWDTVVGRDAVDKKMAVNRIIMDYIADQVGMKACNRYWNKDRMTDEEHEEFWRKNRYLI